MSLKIYNTLTRQKEHFVPQEKNKITFYVCGPTVYNYIHIGNARSAVAFDTIRKYMEYRGYDVNYVSNFTDVDDKIIKAAKEEGLTPKELADKYIQAFKEDTRALNVKPATTHPRVIENIPEIIEFIQVLVDKGYAYQLDNDVYFRTNKLKDYGKLSAQSVNDLLIGASERVDDELTARKETPLDFALWKAAKDDEEISWQSPWGNGRPGWHIECSVMATKYLGDTIDIHGGGQDLQFPHHENEIAQSESKTGQKFSNYWMHNGFVTFGHDEEKMSKSLGNFILLRDLLKEEDPMVVRYLLASVHYRRPLRYDDEALHEARRNVERLREALRRLNHRIDLNETENTDKSIEQLDHLKSLETSFIKAMDDDINAANGMTVVFELLKEINHYLEYDQIDVVVLKKMKSQLTSWLSIFGLELESKELLDKDIQALIDERNQARIDKNFDRSDEIRDQLKEQGILLDDTPQGTVWKRVN